MKAFFIESIGEIRANSEPLKLREVEIPKIRNSEILIKVHACGVCHTEIDEIEGRATPAFLPIIPGHQITGEVVEVGKLVTKFKIGDRVGAGWIYSACGKCEYCLKGFENLCENFKATGKDVHGGYAEYFRIDENFAFLLPENFTYDETAPLFCAGAIGYRALSLAKPEQGYNIALVGFGASAYLVLKMIINLFPNSKVFVFSRTESERAFSIKLGAFWAGNFDEEPPEKLDIAIDTTPVWSPPLSVMKYLKPAGRLIINAIRKENKDKISLLNIDYANDLWLEKEIKTVTNITRKDISEFLNIASKFSIRPEVEKYAFLDASRVLFDIKERKIKGAKVIVFD
jgi:propanol-preferring alcohol dehydrogenase